jgi:hypothetical protein
MFPYQKKIIQWSEMPGNIFLYIRNLVAAAPAACPVFLSLPTQHPAVLHHCTFSLWNERIKVNVLFAVQNADIFLQTDPASFLSCSVGDASQHGLF